MLNDKITKHLKLPFSFNEEELLKDLRTISNEKWLPQLYRMNYEGQWNSLALMARAGKNNTFSFGNNDESIEETSILKHCPYFKQLISKFECPLISVRLLKLNAGAFIKPHKDFKLGYEDNNFRIHIPIRTNEQIEFILDNELLKMLPGECWYTNVNFIHSVANKSTQDRIHLVLDGERNEWSDKIFFSLAPKESFNIASTPYSKETTYKIIEELRNINGPQAKAIIKKLEKELDHYN